MNNKKCYFLISIFVLQLALFACSSVDVKTTQVVEVNHIAEDIPENELLDVGIKLFSPGLEQLDKLEENTLVFPEIRLAESSYFPYMLMNAIQASAAWGAVRVVPNGYKSVDVIVSGNILHSDGELMTVAIEVKDAQGQHWFSKEYSQKASRYSYDKKVRQQKEPFQNIYNRIANDLNSYRQQLTSDYKLALRTITELKFAQDFSPDKYAGHLSKNAFGLYQVNRLPASNDPVYQRILKVRDRDYLFIDTLQDYYARFAKEMALPYMQWRGESYNEVLAVRNMEKRARNQKLIGAAAIVAGILGAGNADASVRAASAIGVAGGAYVLQAGFEREAEAQIHIEALQELGDSLEASIGSHIIELEDRTITLTGTVEDQYKQWREILKDIYQLESGSTKQLN